MKPKTVYIVHFDSFDEKAACIEMLKRHGFIYADRFRSFGSRERHDDFQYLRIENTFVNHRECEVHSKSFVDNVCIPHGHDPMPAELFKFYYGLEY